MPQALKSIEPAAAAKLQEEGALMVDVREPGEYAQARIAGSQNLALSRFAHGELTLAPGQAVIFLCASGNRTSMYAPQLAEKAGRATAYVMRGGLSAWGRAGLSVESGHGEGGARGQGLLARLFGR